MNKCICYTRPDGGLSVVHPAPGSRLVKRVSTSGKTYESPVPVRLEVLLGRSSVPDDLVVLDGETDDDFALRIAAKDVPADAISQRVIDKVDLPSNRYFRDAWTDTGATVFVPIGKARAVHRKRLLERRDAAMKRLSSKIEVADDAGNAALVSQLKLKRAALRNIETKVDADLANLSGLANIVAYVPTEISEQEV